MLSFLRCWTRRFTWLFALVWAALLSAACQAPPSGYTQAGWQYTDLRLIDPADALQPGADLLALYLRAGPGSRQQARLEIRLDLLDYQIEQPASWLVALDHAPGGSSLLPNGSPAGRLWDSLLVVSGGGAISLLDTELQPRPAPAIRVLRDLARQQIEISLSLSALPAARAGLWAQVFSSYGSPLGSPSLDASEPAALHGRPPEPVPLLLAFWDVFPAYTPAQALRRWDGAHTGPAGGRHGLYNLLRAARNHSIPLTLVDLSAPESLSALDYSGGLELVQQMARSRLLAAPAWQPAQAADCDPYSSQQASANFGLPLYNSSSADIFTLISQVQPQPAVQLDERGLSLDARRLLANSARRAGLPVVLGGSLPTSQWGIPEMARSAMAEIRSRPWIRPVSAYALQERLPLRFYPGSPASSPPGSLQLAYQQACSALQAPLYPADDRLEALRSGYSSQLAALQLAAEWENEPFEAAGCIWNFDADSASECLLASNSVLAVFQAQSAALSYLFVRDRIGVHQLVAPSSQFITGQSDPGSWQLAGAAEALLSDPAIIPGAFLQTGDCLPQASTSALVFSCPTAELHYTLTSAGLSVKITSEASSTLPRLLLPLAVDPWQRFSPGWGERYVHTQQDGVLLAGLPPGPVVRLQASQPFQAAPFYATRQWMGQREDPNTEFPPGHYLPFPLVRVEFSSSDSLEVLIELEPPPSGL